MAAPRGLLVAAGEYEKGRRHLRECAYRVDYIITHTAPAETVYYLSTNRSLGIKRSVPEEGELTAFLDEVQSTVEYGRWYFGHFHVDMELWRRQVAVFSTIRRVEDGQIIRTWAPYEG